MTYSYGVKSTQKPVSDSLEKTMRYHFFTPHTTVSIHKQSQLL